MKKCTKCHRELPESQFYKAKRYKGGLRSQCKDCRNAAATQWKKQDKEQRRANERKRYRRLQEAGQTWRQRHIEEDNAQRRQYRAGLRQDAFAAYGGSVCACCGETEDVFLTIDHINVGGAQHRKKINRDIWGWLKQNGYPPGFQILCFNCNYAKHALGVCPHQKESHNITRIETKANA